MPQQSVEVSTDQIIFFFAVALIAVTTLVVFFFTVIYFNFRANARRQQELLRAMLETQEKERSRIALDMHDDLGPLLSAVKLQIGSLRNLPDAQHSSAISEVQQLLDGAIKQIRGIIRDLVPKNIEEKGLAGVLEDMKTHLESAAGVRINLQVADQSRRLPVQTEINIFRIIQEIVNNAIKHADASEINVSLSQTPDHLDLVVADNGKGFDPTLLHEGSGLKNIQTRTQMNHGNLQLHSVPGEGTRYWITFEEKYLH